MGNIHAGAYTVDCPLFVQVSKNKRFFLNLNHYRNAHHHTLSKAKELFTKQIAPILIGKPFMERVRLTYTLFTGSRQLVDVSNVCSIIDKFFSDTLVHAGRIVDDNYQIVLSADYRYGGIDKFNPRVEVTVTPEPTTQPLQEEDEPMQIIITQVEIEEAIRNHVLGQINIRDGMEIAIDLSATRGPEGFKATIDITPSKVGNPTPLTATSTPSPVVAPAKTAVSGAAKTTAAAPKTAPAKTEDKAEDKVAEPADAEPQEDAAADASPDAEPAAPRSSIFGNLKKVSNAPAETAA